jgi:hypothetical protein
MTAQLAAARAIWAERGSSRHQDRAFIAYSVVLGGVVVLAPLIRLVWLFLNTNSALAVLSLPEASTFGGFAVCSLWAGAFVVGATRGPAVLPPFLAYAWTTGPVPGRLIFGRSFARLGVLLGAIFGVIAGAVAASLKALGRTDSGGIVLFGASGVAIGVIAAALWLAGECWPHRTPMLGVAIWVVGAVGLAVPPLRLWSPWAWTMGSYPGVPPGWGIGATFVFAGAVACMLPFLLNRLDGDTVGRQSALWELAVAHSVSLDLRSASSTFQARPRLGRRLRAVVASRQMDAVFFVRGVVGAIRAPARLSRGFALLGASGFVSGMAGADAIYSFALAAGAGVLAYAGLAVVTDSVYHAAQVVSDLPLFGISDGRLLRAQLLFPALVSTVASLSGVLVACSVLSTFELGPVTAALTVTLLALGARVSDSLRGPSPTFLLSSAPSAMGDPMPALRILWALDAPILAAVAGVSSIAPHPIWIVAAGAAIAATCVARWVRRD